MQFHTAGNVTKSPFRTPVFYVNALLSAVPALLVFTDDMADGDWFQYLVWTIPFMLCLSASYSLSLMCSLDFLVGELETSKYKLKGA